MKYLNNLYYAIGLCNLMIAVEAKNVYCLLVGIILITFCKNKGHINMLLAIDK